jgi:HPt (histidine-containing phosphotransfer) domain-containing protein
VKTATEAKPAATKLDQGARESLARMGGEALVEKIFGMFAERAPEVVRLSREAAAAGERGEVERLSHGLVSSASYVGAMDVVERSHTLEHAAPEADDATIEEMITELDKAVAAILDEVKAVGG